MDLPQHSNLHINILAGCFKKKAATYKFYWFLSILQLVEKGHFRIDKHLIFSKMICNAWYTVNFFHLSFGKQDELQRAIKNLHLIGGFTIDIDSEKLYRALTRTSDINILNELRYFDNQVPHWFLSPWFPKNSKEGIYANSKVFLNDCPYALFKDEIVINPLWQEYLITNNKFLKDFCYWNLTLFLQKKNPNVPDLPNKLIKSAKRSNLSNQRNYFWNFVFQHMDNEIECIYTKRPLQIPSYALDHFVPYNFVSHNLIWNLIPADKEFNLLKTDKLPSFDRYFDSFFDLQSKAMKIVADHNPGNNILQDYLTIVPSLTEGLEKDKFRDTIKPLINIASNNGFQYLDETAEYI